jgi:hypothetical protein
MTIQQKLNLLTEDSVWIFTKQSTDFDEAFRAARLFNDAYKQEVNLEDYFSLHYAEYEISTDRHRVWIISQLFGLITKTPFYSRGSHYANERPTAVFDLLNQCEIGDENYNTLKSEQLLKVRLKPITDSTHKYDQVLLPLLFSYLTLKELETKHNILEISLDQFYSYIATCKRFSEIEETAFLLSQNPQNSSFIQKYRDRSRIVPLFEKNSSLLDFSDNKVKINSNFDEYFYKNLVSKFDIKDLELILEDQNAYAYFLYNCQNFNVNLIDNPAEKIITDNDNIIPFKNILEISDDNETYDSEYVKKVDEVKEENINTEIARDAYKNDLKFLESKRGVKVLKNPIFGKIAIKQSDYRCNANENHATFESNKTKRDFMEAHHLIPMNKAKSIFEEQKINIDCVENLVSLCPNCHRATHYGSTQIKKELLANLYNKKVGEYQKIGLKISLEELLKMY